MATVTRYPSSQSGEWTNGSNMLANDSTYAECAPAKYSTVTQLVWGFNFGIPSGATINSITVEVERHLSTTASNGALYFRVQKNNANYGTELSTSTEPTTETIYTQTNNGVWTADELNSNLETGMRIYVSENRSSSSNAKTAYCDFVRVTVDYTAPITASGSFAQII